MERGICSRFGLKGIKQPETLKDPGDPSAGLSERRIPDRQGEVHEIVKVKRQSRNALLWFFELWRTSIATTEEAIQFRGSLS